MRNIKCRKCKQTNRSSMMLLCDSCNCGFHIDCLQNPLTAVPDGEWFCCVQCESRGTYLKHSLGHKGSASEPESSSGSELDSELESSSDGDYATDSEDSGPSFLKRKRRVVIEDDSEDEAEIDKRTPRCFKSFELDDSVDSVTVDPVTMVSVAVDPVVVDPVAVDPVAVDQVKLDVYIAKMRNHGCMKTKAAIKADWMSIGS
jgi:hypothetical protein